MPLKATIFKSAYHSTCVYTIFKTLCVLLSGNSDRGFVLHHSFNFIQNPRMKRGMLLFHFFILNVGAYSQTRDSLFIRRIADSILTNGTAYHNLKVLTKQVGGRLAGSPQMVKAERWGLAAMKTA